MEVKDIQSFWDWFSKNHHKYQFAHEVEEDIKNEMLDELLEALHRCNPNLFFAIGRPTDDGLSELVITAEGIVAHFESVEKLVDTAPMLDNWLFTKFKQPQGSSFQISFRGKEFDPEQTIFLPLSSEDNPRGVGIQVCYPDYEVAEKEIFLNGTYIMLDTLLGEKSAAEDIDFIEIIQTPADIAGFYFMHLDELAEYIEEKKELKE